MSSQQGVLLPEAFYSLNQVSNINTGSTFTQVVIGLRNSFKE